MKSKKNSIYFIISALVILSVYNLLVFILSEERINVFWLAYSFTTLALLFQLSIPIFLVSDKQMKKDAFISIPIVLHCILYTIVQLIIGVILMLVSINFKIAFLIEVVIFAIFLLNIISALIGKNIIETTGDEVREKTSFIRTLTIEVETLGKNTTDELTSKKLKELEDVVRYSDPVSNPALKSIEQKIQMSISSLTPNIKKSDVISEIDNILKLFDERNRKCKSMK